MFSQKRNHAFPVKFPLSGYWLKRADQNHEFHTRVTALPGWFKQIIRFGLVGILNTLVDAAFYFLLSRLGLIPNLVLAKGISYSLGVMNSFCWNKAWTFKSHVESRRVFLPFIASNLLAVGLNVGVMHLALDILSWPESGALILATATTFIWNFVINKFFIFK
jgi:putative flippase GtrA